MVSLVKHQLLIDVGAEAARASLLPVCTWLAS